MHALLPTAVALSFLCYAAYELRAHGANRVSLAFFLFCAATFCWQFSAAVLFRTHDPRTAYAVAKFAYLLILFLPTTLYHFVAELTSQEQERPWVALSYGIAALLGVVLLETEWIISGVYPYFFGFYPKAGPWHPAHLLQTSVVAGRALYLLYRRHRLAVSTEKLRMRYCAASVLIYLFAAVDYLCNYGLQFYPPGAVFVAVSLGLITQARSSIPSTPPAGTAPALAWGWHFASAC